MRERNYKNVGALEDDFLAYIQQNINSVDVKFADDPSIYKSSGSAISAKLRKLFLFLTKDGRKKMIQDRNHTMASFVNERQNPQADIEIVIVGSLHVAGMISKSEDVDMVCTNIVEDVDMVCTSTTRKRASWLFHKGRHHLLCY